MVDYKHSPVEQLLFRGDDLSSMVNLQGRTKDPHVAVRLATNIGYHRLHGVVHTLSICFRHCQYVKPPGSVADFRILQIWV